LSDVFLCHSSTNSTVSNFLFCRQNYGRSVENTKTHINDNGYVEIVGDKKTYRKSEKMAKTGSRKKGSMKQKKTTEQLLAEVVNKKMDKEIEKIEKKAQVKKVKGFEYNHRDVFAIGEAFAKSIKAEVGTIKIHRKEDYEACTVMKGNRCICWFLPSANKEERFRIYLFGDGPKQIIKVHNDKEQEQCFSTITDVYNTVEAKKVKQSKPRAPKQPKELRALDKVLRQLDKLEAKKAMTIPPGYLPDNEEFVKAVEEHKGRFDWDNGLIFKTQVGK